MKRIKYKNVILFLLIILSIALFIGGSIYIKNVKIMEEKKIQAENERKRQEQEKQKQDILSHYGEYVKALKTTSLFSIIDGEYVEVGVLGEGEELSLDQIEIDYNTIFFKVKTFNDEYYVKYEDVSKIDSLSTYSKRYKSYIPFNINVVTKEKTSFYDDNNKLVYTLPKSFDLPIIINYGTSFGVEFNDRLLFIKSDDVEITRDNSNTTLSNTSGIAVLNYHFFYDSSSADEVKDCNQILCVSIDNLKKHLDYIKNNNFFTPTMREFEQYVDGSVRLPKSVLITIDDGWRAEYGARTITQYGLNATLFLMTKYYDPAAFRTDYVEVHSHGHDIHNNGVCPGGQGGGIKCLDKPILLEDLRLSREKLNNSTYFCYPFYEYNNYAIEVLKEAGFTMAFAGYKEGGHSKAYPGINKFKIPRYPIHKSTGVNTIANYIN